MRFIKFVFFLKIRLFERFWQIFVGKFLRKGWQQIFGQSFRRIILNLRFRKTKEIGFRKRSNNSFNIYLKK